MAEERKRKQRISWTKEQTDGLLDCYAARAHELQHSRRKKYAYEHILEDMLSAGLVDSSVTTLHLENKMHTLMRAYKTAVDNNDRTGAAPSIIPFKEKMDSIFGNKPIISKVHTVDIGVDAVPVGEEALISYSPEPELPSSTASTPIFTPSSGFVGASTSASSYLDASPAAAAASSTSTDSFDSPTPAKRNKLTRTEYYAKKLEMRKEEKQIEREDKLKIWKEHVEIERKKEESRRERTDILKSLLNKK